MSKHGSYFRYMSWLIEIMHDQCWILPREIRLNAINLCNINPSASKRLSHKLHRLSRNAFQIKLCRIRMCFLQYRLAKSNLHTFILCNLNTFWNPVIIRLHSKKASCQCLICAMPLSCCKKRTIK